MKWYMPGIGLIVGIVSVCSTAQPKPVNALQVNLCDIVNHPLQFKGKLVRVRAQIWSNISHANQFWLNEASIEFDKPCHFLPAEFKPGTALGGSAASGSFVGRVVSDPAPIRFDVPGDRRERSSVMLVIEQQSDIHGLRYYSGPVPVLQLFDSRSNSFVRPQSRPDGLQMPRLAATTSR